MQIKLLKEPFFHFLLLGGIIYLYYLTTPSSQQVSSKEKIIITSNEIAYLKKEYQKEMHRPINDKEKELYIQNLFYEKVLLQEAYSLGLYKKDKKIAQELLTKMQFIMKNSIKIDEPTEEQLRAYYDANKKDYSQILSLSFANVFVKTPQDKEATQLYELLQLQHIDPKYASSFGEQCRLSNIVKDTTLAEAKVIYGNYFATKLFKLKSGVWHSAITSKFGAHILYITDKKVAEPYPFDDVEDRVYEDYMAEKKAQQKEQSFKKIATQYSLEIE
jgi:hypothetical protein